MSVFLIFILSFILGFMIGVRLDSNQWIKMSKEEFVKEVKDIKKARKS